MKTFILLIASLVAVSAEVANLQDHRPVEFVCEKDTENQHGSDCLLSCDVMFWDTKNENNKEYEDRYNLCKHSAASEENICDRNEELRACFLHDSSYEETSDEYEITYSMDSL
uniref:Salivary OBP/D7 family protein n=1 Tax=Simulium vittatum TaxID=7192 RepID=B5M0W6_SIMVI|nr:salivary OBP/D7 family protein [Simulium vittatum]